MRMAIALIVFALSTPSLAADIWERAFPENEPSHHLDSVPTILQGFALSAGGAGVFLMSQKGLLSLRKDLADLAASSPLDEMRARQQLAITRSDLEYLLEIEEESLQKVETLKAELSQHGSDAALEAQLREAQASAAEATRAAKPAKKALLKEIKSAIRFRRGLLPEDELITSSSQAARYKWFFRGTAGISALFMVEGALDLLAGYDNRSNAGSLAALRLAGALVGE